MPRRNRWPEGPSQKRKKRNHKRKPARERNMRLQQNARITGKR